MRFNGLTLNGMRYNGIRWNGLSLNGVALNGSWQSAPHVNGMAIKAIRLPVR